MCVIWGQKGNACIETGANNRVRISIKVGHEGVLEIYDILPFPWRIAEIVLLVVVVFILVKVVWEREKRSKEQREF